MPKSDQRTIKPRKDGAEAVEAAVALCRVRGAQITPLREAVLTVLWSATGPIGAYELRDTLSEQLARKISASTIYRTLDFLCDYGVVSRIESRNAYVACEHPQHDHACILFVCDDCGTSSEIENERLQGLLTADAETLGFTIGKRVVELSGSCAECREAAR